MSDKYEIQYDFRRIGWCVFKKNNDGMTVQFQAGPFVEKASADSELRRLNGIDAGSLTCD